jgi:hypothetical protein
VGTRKGVLPEALGSYTLQPNPTREDDLHTKSSTPSYRTHSSWWRSSLVGRKSWMPTTAPITLTVMQVDRRSGIDTDTFDRGPGARRKESAGQRAHSCIAIR